MRGASLFSPIQGASMANEYLNNAYLESIIARFQEAKRECLRCEMIAEDNMCRDQRRNRKQRDKNNFDLEEAKGRFSVAQSELATAFYLLSENLVRYAKFYLIDPDDAIQEGVLICFEKIDRFDPSKGKAFNYMTTCIFNHLKQNHRTIRNYNELKRKYHDFLQDTMDSIYLGGTHGKTASRWQSHRLQS
jgi:hypothetical protein